MSFYRKKVKGFRIVLNKPYGEMSVLYMVILC